MNIVPRSQWAGDIPASGVPSRIGLPAPRVWLHHGASGYSTVATARSYVRFHIRTRGWQDVGYSFLIAEGKVLEGRGPGRQGAHTRSDNSESHGIVVCGNYTRTEPAQRDIDALRWLLDHGHRQGWWPSPAFTGGHRNAPGASTTCPGDRLQRRLGDINRPATKEDTMSVASWAKTSWDKARNRGVFSEHTAPKETITAESLAVFLDRAGLLDHINGPAIGHAVRLKKRMDDAQSSEYYVGEVISHLRDHPSSGGGLSQSEADGRYVRRGTSVKLP